MRKKKEREKYGWTYTVKVYYDSDKKYEGTNDDNW